jgi:hypothetical protein
MGNIQSMIVDESYKSGIIPTQISFRIGLDENGIKELKLDQMFIILNHLICFPLSNYWDSV